MLILLALKYPFLDVFDSLEGELASSQCEKYNATEYYPRAGFLQCGLLHLAQSYLDAEWIFPGVRCSHGLIESYQ